MFLAYILRGCLVEVEAQFVLGNFRFEPGGREEKGGDDERPQRGDGARAHRPSRPNTKRAGSSAEGERNSSGVRSMTIDHLVYKLHVLCRTQSAVAPVVFLLLFAEGSASAMKGLGRRVKKLESETEAAKRTGNVAGDGSDATSSDVPATFAVARGTTLTRDGTPLSCTIHTHN